MCESLRTLLDETCCRSEFIRSRYPWRFQNIQDMFLNSLHFWYLVLDHVFSFLAWNRESISGWEILNAENFHLNYTLYNVAVMPSGLWPGESGFRRVWYISEDLILGRAKKTRIVVIYWFLWLYPNVLSLDLMCEKDYIPFIRQLFQIMCAALLNPRTMEIRQFPQEFIRWLVLFLLR